MAGRQLVTDLGRHRRELHDRLGDPSARIGVDLLGDGRQLLGRRVWPEHDAVPAGTLHRFDDEFVDPVEDLFALLAEPAAEGVDVGQQRFLAEVVLDDRGHVGVDELVVADPVADGAGDHHVAGARGVEDAGHPEHRIRFELHRIQEVVVDAAVDHVDLTLPSVVRMYTVLSRQNRSRPSTSSTPICRASSECSK